MIPAVILGSIFMVLVIAALDYVTGPLVAVAILYLVPILVTSWVAGRRWGIFMAVLSEGGHVVADVLAPMEMTRLSPLIATWNAFARLAVYVVVNESIQAIKLGTERRRRTVAELEVALDEVQTLRGLLPICAWCRRIRDEDDEGRWKDLEEYIGDHTEVRISHGICPSCKRLLEAQATAPDRPPADR